MKSQGTQWRRLGGSEGILNQGPTVLRKHELCGAKLWNAPPIPTHDCLYHVCGIDISENVQRKFTISLQSPRSISYLDRLNILNTENLELKREKLTFYF